MPYVCNTMNNEMPWLFFKRLNSAPQVDSCGLSNGHCTRRMLLLQLLFDIKARKHNILLNIKVSAAQFKIIPSKSVIMLASLMLVPVRQIM